MTLCYHQALKGQSTFVGQLFHKTISSLSSFHAPLNQISSPDYGLHLNTKGEGGLQYGVNGYLENKEGRRILIFSQASYVLWR